MDVFMKILHENDKKVTAAAQAAGALETTGGASVLGGGAPTLSEQLYK
jgi:hypothetical protein